MQQNGSASIAGRLVDGTRAVTGLVVAATPAILWNMCDPGGQGFTATVAGAAVPRSPAAWRRVACAVSILALLVLPAAGLRAQAFTLTPDPVPDIALFQAAPAQVLLSLADGGVLVAGYFAAINGLRRPGLARLAADGGVDPHWQPPVVHGIRQILELPDGSLVVAGAITGPDPASSINGLTRLTAAGVEIPGNRLVLSGQVAALALAADGSVFVGGSFTSLAGQPRRNLAKLIVGPTLTLDPAWNPAPENGVNALLVDDRGDLIVGGAYNFISGEYRGGLAKVAGTGAGALDPVWRPLPNSFISDLAPGPAGSVIVAGYFSQIGGQSRTRLAKLDTSGTGRADPSWNPAAAWSTATSGESIYALASTPEHVYVGGRFSQLGGLSRCCVARISAHGTGLADPHWSAPAMRPFEAVAQLAVNGSGDLIIGGDLRTESPAPSLGLAHLHRSTGQVVSPLWLGAPGQVDAIGLQPDGGAIVAGRFDLADDQYRENLLRITPAGQVDPAWRPAVGQGVRFMQIDAAGDVYLGGFFQQVDGQDRRYIARLSGRGAGTVDPDWVPVPDAHVDAMAIEPGGSLLVGGRFIAISGQPRRYLARIRADGELDPDWAPVVDDWVSALALDRHGRVLVGAGTLRRFDLANGQADAAWRPILPRSHRLAIDAEGRVYSANNLRQEFTAWTTIAMVSGTAAGDLQPIWQQRPYGTTFRLLPLASGGVLAAGEFGSTNPSMMDTRLMALGADGAALPIAVPGFDWTVHAAERGADQALWIGGRFRSSGGQERLGLARFMAGSGVAPANGVPLGSGVALVLALLAWLLAWSMRLPGWSRRTRSKVRPVVVEARCASKCSTAGGAGRVVH